MCDWNHSLRNMDWAVRRKESLHWRDWIFVGHTISLGGRRPSFILFDIAWGTYKHFTWHLTNHHSTTRIAHLPITNYLWCRLGTILAFLPNLIVICSIAVDERSKYWVDDQYVVWISGIPLKGVCKAKSGSIWIIPAITDSMFDFSWGSNFLTTGFNNYNNFLTTGSNNYNFLTKESLLFYNHTP